MINKQLKRVIQLKCVGVVLWLVSTRFGDTARKTLLTLNPQNTGFCAEERYCTMHAKVR